MPRGTGKTTIVEGAVIWATLNGHKRFPVIIGADMTAAAGITTRVAATQDAVALVGRAGGTSSYVATITPGTLTEERLLEGRRANWLLSVFEGAAEVGLAWADISTGELWLAAVPAGALADEIARIGPAEVLVPEGAGQRGTELPKAAFDSAGAERALAARLGVATLEGFGAFPRAALAAAGGLLRHVEATARGSTVLLKPPRLYASGAVMAIDRATRASLELTEGPTSLLGAIDLTVTAAGGRLLAGELAAPLAELEAIEARLDLVQWFAGDADLRGTVRRILKGAPDVARALGRIGAGRGSPRDLAALRDGLRAAREVGAVLDSAFGGAPVALDPIRLGLEPPRELLALLEAALVESPPLNAGDGGVIAEGHDSALDELRLLAADSRAAIAALNIPRIRRRAILCWLRCSARWPRLWVGRLHPPMAMIAATGGKKGGLSAPLGLRPHPPRIFAPH
jgi:DNA mismatch repair protein MutS